MSISNQHINILACTLLVAVVLAPAVSATNSVYSDVETSVANIFQAGVWGGGDEPDPDPEIVFVDGNPSCASLEYPEEAKIEPIPGGLVVLPLVIPGVGTVTVTVTEVNDEDEGITFDWSADFGIDAVIAKGGPNANLYIYDPPAESFGDNGLQPPLGAGPGGTQPFGISHVSFCYDADPEPAVLSAFSLELSDEPLEIKEEESAPEEGLPEVEVSEEPLEVVEPVEEPAEEPTDEPPLPAETEEEPEPTPEPPPELEETEEAPGSQEETSAPEEIPTEEKEIEIQ